MLTWDEKIRKDQAGTVLNESYQTQLPHWGEVSVHPHIHHPGEMFLDCLALDIDTHPLGRVTARDAIGPAEMILLRTLKDHAIRCLEAMVAIGNAEEATNS